MTRARISRRSMLAATGASALLLPLLSRERAHGADPVFPKRIIFVVTGNGTIEEAFWPKAGAGGLTLGEITAPLEAHKSRLLFPRGIDMRVWSEDNPFGGNGDAHHNFGAILTGTRLATGDPPHDPGGPGLALASSISIDQHLGKQLNAQAQAEGKTQVPFPVLSVRAWGRDGTGYATLSWTGNRAPVSAESDPRKLFSTLFSGQSGAKPDPTLVRLQQTRRSVLDYVGVALERQAKRLGTDDRRKVEIHLEAVRNIERQLQGATTTSACATPSLAATDYKAMQNFPALVEAEMDLIVAALACGSTRVATYAIGDGEDYNVYFPWLGLTGKGIEFPTRHKHDIAHRPGTNNADKIATEKWFMSSFARLLDKLNAVPEGGGTLLDNTVVLFLNSLNSGFGHSVLKLPIIVAGGAQLGIRSGGRLLELKNEAHNKLLAALANAVGVPMSGWGDPRFGGTLNLG
jgi:Protein of unknown function (DUF1552)